MPIRANLRPCIGHHNAHDVFTRIAPGTQSIIPSTLLCSSTILLASFPKKLYAPYYKDPDALLKVRSEYFRQRGPDLQAVMHGVS